MLLFCFLSLYSYKICYTKSIRYINSGVMNMKIPKYEAIFNDIVRKIDSKVYKPNEKLPTEIDMAKEYDVSRITVTRAYKELADNHYVYRVKGHGTYVKKEQGSALVAKRNQGYNFLSVIIQDNQYIAELFQGIEEIAIKEGYIVTFHNAMLSHSLERKIIKDVMEKGTSGIILYPNNTTMNMKVYSSLVINKFPFVTIDHSIPNFNTSFVSVDNYKSFYNLTKYLLDLGHRNITFVGLYLYSVSSEYERYQGFCQAHIDYGIPLSQNHLIYVKDFKVTKNDELSEDDYCDIIKSFMETYLNMPKDVKPTAIACVNDELARMIIKVGLKMGVHFPDDLSISGFDDLPYSEHLQVPLTTVKQPAKEIGKAAATELIRRIKYPDSGLRVVKIQTQLVERQSTGKITL